MKVTLWCLLFRMIVIPVLLFLIFRLLGMSGLPYKVTLMESAMPPALTTGILALQFHLDEELAISCIGLGTVMSMILFTAAMAVSTP